MNNDLTPDFELASAALDNQLSAADLARVEASHQLRSQRDSYAAIGDRLRQIEVPVAARESAMAAAFAVFDAEFAQTEAPTPSAAPSLAPNVVALHRRRQGQYRAVMGFAAAAMVVVAGIALLRPGTDSKSAATLSTAAESAKLAPEQVPNLEVASGTLVVSADEATAYTTSATDATMREAASTAAPAAEMATQATTSGLTAIPAAAEVTLWASAPVFGSEAELVTYMASDAFTLAANPFQDGLGKTAATADTHCLTTTDTLVMPANYLGINSWLVRDTTPRQVRIINPTDCSVATVPLP